MKNCLFSQRNRVLSDCPSLHLSLPGVTTWKCSSSCKWIYHHRYGGFTSQFMMRIKTMAISMLFTPTALPRSHPFTDDLPVLYLYLPFLKKIKKKKSNFNINLPGALVVPNSVQGRAPVCQLSWMK